MVDGNVILAWQLWMHIVSCCRFVNGGVLTSATFKLGHTSMSLTMKHWNVGSLWKQKGFEVDELIG